MGLGVFVQRIYLDANATTPLLPEVLEAMRPFLLEQFGNASSIHQEGQHARAAVEQARASVARLLGCRPAEIVFTSGGTEGDNLAIFGSVRPGDHVITSAVEHHAVLHAVQRLADRGVDVDSLPVDGQSVVAAGDLRKALRPNTRLISLMMANNETGVLQPVEEIGKIAEESDVYFHVDAVQAASKVAIDVRRIACDALSISGHKMHAPQGVGALYVRQGTQLRPLFYGGRHERSRRAGTENVPGIVGLGRAAELATQGFDQGHDKKMSELRDRLGLGILAQLQDAGVNGEGAARVPNTTNIYFDSIEGESVTILLDLKGVACATGAACSAGAIEPSHVLLAMGLSSDRARSSIRFSLGKQNTSEEIEIALTMVPEAVVRLRELSPMRRKEAVSN